MSATPPNDTNDPKSKKEQSNAVLWAVLAAAFAVFMFVQSGKVEPDKKNFYLLAGGAGAVLAAVNGYGAWAASQKK